MATQLSVRLLDDAAWFLCFWWLSNHAVDVEDVAATQHEVNGSSQLDRQQRVGSGLAVFVFDPLAERFGLRAIAA